MKILLYAMVAFLALQIHGGFCAPAFRSHVVIPRNTCALDNARLTVHGIALGDTRTTALARGGVPTSVLEREIYFEEGRVRAVFSAGRVVYLSGPSVERNGRSWLGPDTRLSDLDKLVGVRGPSGFCVGAV